MSDLLKNYRILKGFSQANMAELLGVSKSLVSMVEHGRRELTDEALQIFNSMRKGGQKSPENGHINPVSGFKKIRAEHMQTSAEYVESYRRDCQFELHKYEKQVKIWKEEYDVALGELIRIASELKSKKDKNISEKSSREIASRCLRAEIKLGEIAGKKPEILMFKIEGLKQQLRTIKTMMGKNRKHLGMNQQGAIALLKAPGTGLLQIDLPSKMLSNE